MITRKDVRRGEAADTWTTNKSRPVPGDNTWG